VSPHRRAEDRPLPAQPAGRPDAADHLVGVIGRCTEGDEGAFAELYDLTSRRVYGLVLAVLRDPAQSEEVAQDVFLEVWRTSSRFDPDRGSVLAWMLAMSHRRAVDRVRASQASRNRDQRYLDANQQIAHDATSDDALASVEALRVRAALEQIPWSQRTALTLAYFEGCTHQEVAERLDIPLGTAKSRIRDGLIKLRELVPPPSKE
jgi:RNA polymerase sigma-70 factor (ECF subfamily)